MNTLLQWRGMERKLWSNKSIVDFKKKNTFMIEPRCNKEAKVVSGVKA